MAIVIMQLDGNSDHVVILDDVEAKSLGDHNCINFADVFAGDFDDVLVVSLWMFAKMFMTLLVIMVQLPMLQSYHDLPFSMFGNDYNCDDVQN